MNNKANFISFVNVLVENSNLEELKSVYGEVDFEGAFDYFDKKIIAEKSATKASNPQTFTDNGKKLYDFMLENSDTYENAFTALNIAEGLFISTRSVGGTMRKLVTDGHVVKSGENPIIYSIHKVQPSPTTN